MSAINLIGYDLRANDFYTITGDIRVYKSP